MATVKFTIGERGGDRPELIMKLTISNAQKVQAKTKGLLVYRDYWSDAKQCIDTSRKFIKPWEQDEISIINKTISNLKSEILTRCSKTPYEEINRVWLKAQIDEVLHPEKFEKKETTPQTLMQAITTHIDNTLCGERTKVQYKNTKRRVREYLDEEDMTDLPIECLDKTFYTSFVNFLYSKGYKKNTVGKHIKNLKAVINSLPLAQRAKCEFIEPRKCAKLTEEVDNIYLTEEELDKIASLKITTPYLDRIRDQFIMLAWTGCRYSDLDKLNSSNIKEIDGVECFKLEQQKTKNRVIIPILPAVKSIMDKYGNEMPKPMTNQKFNEYIKDIAKMAGLDEDVTITHTEQQGRVTRHYKKWECVSAHTARRSFATNMYKRDFPSLMIMAITGHKTEKAFLTYIKVKQEEHAERMFKLFMEQERRN